MSSQASHPAQAASFGEWGPVRCLWVQQVWVCPDAHALCPMGPSSKEWGMLPKKQASLEPRHCSHCLSLLFVSAASGARSCPGGDGGQLPGESAAWLLPLIRALTNASLTGLPTPGSKGEFDTKLKIAAVLFLRWRGGAGRGAPAPFNDLPTKNKAFSLRSLCFHSALASSTL